MSNPTGDALVAIGITDTQRLTRDKLNCALKVHYIATTLRATMSAALSTRGWYRSKAKTPVIQADTTALDAQIIAD